MEDFEDYKKDFLDLLFTIPNSIEYPLYFRTIDALCENVNDKTLLEQIYIFYKLYFDKTQKLLNEGTLDDFDSLYAYNIIERIKSIFNLLFPFLEKNKINFDRNL